MCGKDNNVLLVPSSGWGSTAVGAFLALLPAALSWWLAAYTNHYRLAAWINTSSALLIMAVMYWQSPFFGLYFLFLLQLVVVRIILGRRETNATFFFGNHLALLGAK